MPSLVVQAPPLPFPSCAGGGGVERGNDERRVVANPSASSLVLSLSQFVLVNLAMARVHVSPLPRAIFHSYPKLCKIFLGYCDSADKRKCVKITELTDEFAI